MSKSDSDDPAVRPADIGKLTQELEDTNACEESTSAETPVDINEDIAQLSHPQEVSDACHDQQRSNVQSVCPLGTGIEVDTVNGSLDGGAMANDTAEVTKEPSDEPNQNVVNEVVNGGKSKLCVDGIDARAHNESDENNSKDETKFEDLNNESRNSKDTHLNMNSKNWKRRKLPVKDYEFDSRDVLMTSNDDEDAAKPTIVGIIGREAKVSKAKKPTTASSSRAQRVELALTDESKDNPVDKETAEQICIDDWEDLTTSDDAASGPSRNRPKVRSSVYPRRVVSPFSRGEYAGRIPRKPLIETRWKKKKTKLEDLKDESRNSKVANLNKYGEKSKRRKLPVRVDKHDGFDFLTPNSDDEGAEKPTMRREAKVSKAKEPTTASSSRAKNVDLASTDKWEDNLVEATLIRPGYQRVMDEVEDDPRGKVERMKRRAQRKVERAKMEEWKAKQKLEHEETCRENIRAHAKRRQMKRRNVEVLSDDRRRNLPQQDQFPCPICTKNFAAEEIEFHAAHCEEFDAARSAGGSRLYSPVVAMSLGTPNQRDKFSSMPGKAWLENNEAEEPTRRKKATFASVKKPTTASSTTTKSAELVSTAESKDNLAEAKSIRQEERRIRDEAATRRKVERVKQRLQEESKKAKLEERNEQLTLSFEQTWREKMRAGQKVPGVEVVPENHSGMQRDVEVLSDDWRDNLSQTDRVLCPICSKDFSIVEIEIHAARCEQYEPVNSTEDSRSNSPVASASLETPKQQDVLSTPLKCDTCSNFTASNERELEDHVASCLPRQNDVDDGNGSVVMASNSPAVPISFETPEQRDMLSNMPGQAGLPDGEVAEELEDDEEATLQWSLVDSSVIISSGPLSLSSMERAEQQKEDEIKLINLEKQRVRDEEETRRTSERAEQGVQEEAEKANLEEQNEKRRLKNEQTWREKMREKDEQRQTARIESSPEGPGQSSDVPSIEVVQENHSGPQQRDVEERCDDRRRNLSQTEQFPCPICGINFPAAVIERHASRCVEDAPASSAGCSTSNSPVVPLSSRAPKQRGMSSTLLECYMCSKFTARNGWEFEEHVTSCLARQREREHEAA